MIFIFDLWGTLGNKNASFSKALSKHFGIDFGSIYHELEESVQLEKWESLEDLAKSFLSTFSLDVNEENAEFVVKAQEAVVAYATPFDEIRIVLARLKQKHKLYLLSNTTCFEAIVIERWGFREFFHKQFLSFETGKLKPNKDTFENVLTDLGVAASECVFVDDNKNNCATARTLGMKAHQFRGLAEFEKFLLEEKF